MLNSRLRPAPSFVYVCSLALTVTACSKPDSASDRTQLPYSSIDREAFNFRAAELHLHPRDLDGRESLTPATMDATMLAMRRSCPGTLIGVSTGAWIEGNERRTLACIDGWNELPDYASVNL